MPGSNFAQSLEVTLLLSMGISTLSLVRLSVMVIVSDTASPFPLMLISFAGYLCCDSLLNLAYRQKAEIAKEVCWSGDDGADFHALWIRRLGLGSLQTWYQQGR